MVEADYGVYVTDFSEESFEQAKIQEKRDAFGAFVIDVFPDENTFGSIIKLQHADIRATIEKAAAISGTTEEVAQKLIIQDMELIIKVVEELEPQYTFKIFNSSTIESIVIELQKNIDDLFLNDLKLKFNWRFRGPTQKTFEQATLEAIDNLLYS